MKENFVQADICDTEKVAADKPNGREFCDKYKFLTNNSVRILKKHGNLIIALSTFNEGLERACLEHLGRDLFNNVKDNTDYRKLYSESAKIILQEAERLVGFKVRYKIYQPVNYWENHTVMIFKDKESLDVPEPPRVLVGDNHE